MASSLSRTPSGAGNQRTWTYSGWFKLCTTDQNLFLLSAGAYGDSKSMQFLIANSGNFLQFQGFSSGGSADFNCETNAELRDTNAWYHIMVACDTTQATASDRAKIYINGELQTLRTATYPTQNYDTGVNTTIAHEINDRPGGSLEQQLYGSHIHMADGNTYAATVFGETDTTTGQWKIKTSPSVSYGTNGFFIMKDNGSGTDQSGQSNNWTANGTITNTEDCPSDVFNTINVLNIQITGLTISNGNLTRSSNTGDAWRTTYGTLAASSGKFYWEQKVTGSVGSAHYIGITDQDENRQTNTNDFENANVSAYCYRGDGGKVTSVSGSTVLTASAGDSFTANDIIGVAMDLDNQKIYFSKNGTWQASGDPTSGSTGTGSFFNITAGKLYTPATACYNSGAGYHYNFGNGFFGTTAISSEGSNASGIGKFEYDVPTGYTALSTKGLNE